MILQTSDLPWWQTPTAKALFAGVILTLSFPPLPLGFLGYIGLIPFFYALEQTDGEHGFRLGYIAGLVYTGGMIYWIGANSGTFPWAAILSAIMAVAFMALNFGLFGWALGWIKRKEVSGGLWWAPVLWVAVEFLRSFGTLVMPWVSLSLSQTDYLPAIQMAGITGMYGVSFWVVLLNVVIIRYLMAKDVGKPTWKWAIVAFAIYLIPLGYGTVILRVLPGVTEESKPVKVSVLQPNVDPNQKWSSQFRRENYALLDSLTSVVTAQEPDIAIWPETATPSYLRYNRYGYLTKLRKKVNSTGIPLLTGTPDWRPPDSVTQGDDGSIYNAAVLIEQGSENLQTYRKVKLVPFAEYVPYQRIFGFFYKLDLGQGNYTPGEKYTVFNLNEPVRTKFSVAICYDSSFPELLRRFRQGGAEWQAIITNDAWFGNTSGPYQHAEWAKMRAVEYRTPIARSANTGISMLIDGWGRVRQSLPLNSQGTLTGTLETNLRPTFYAKFGDVFSIIITLIAIGGIGWGFAKQ
ncbi:MAG: apolipoprotein N-acyltransferase [Candidatus Marinimicrobia bacterium]|nr:apolipoprotein N-acyltransferase [Candidatus Neomarinimicrobiota bacterium]MCF7829696.1 apolipoprotein N-acyltransferase [Candidatus Neomarinimicrobiota bacterium]MCF7881646.1 apolipoprotein N-acyltransferase [Candidatus Neomarinimicrobiota bacterium]